MNILKWVTCLAVTGLLLGCDQKPDSTGSSAGDQAVSSGSGAGAPAAPDNTAVNKRDRTDATLTPGDQGATEADREMTRRIRRAITSNDQLSTDAKNIKIITINGKVTLRGPVKDAQEQQAVQAIAQQAGVTSVDNQLELKATNQ